MKTLALLALVATTALVLLLPAAAPAAHAPFRFVGQTSQHERVSFQIPYSFVGVRRFRIIWDAKCTSGATLRALTWTSGTIPFGRGFVWRFHDVYSYTDAGPGYSASDGRRLRFRVSATTTGKVPDSIRPRGTESTTTKVTDPSTGQAIDTCTTGRVTWKADIQ